jgi:dephospho-CoA kinase
MGADVFSADEVVRGYYQNKQLPVVAKIREEFPEAFTDNGDLKQDVLARIVFSEEHKLRRLESLVHPLVISDLKNQLESRQHQSGVYIAEIPLLFEKKLDIIFNKVILVYAPQTVLIERIKRKFDVTTQQALRRLRFFSKIEDKKNKADFIIVNDDSIENLKTKVEVLWQKLKKKPR